MEGYADATQHCTALETSYSVPWFYGTIESYAALQI
jgi:hypothetical protein